MATTTTRAMSSANVKYVLETMGLEEDQINYLVKDNGIARIGVLEGMTKELLEDVVSSSNGVLKIGNMVAIEHFQKWCRWYRGKNNGKLPLDWGAQFDEDAMCEHSASMEVKEVTTQQQAGSQAESIKEDSDDDENYKAESYKFRVKLSEFPDFDGRQHSWCNFRDKFSAACEAAGMEDCLTVNFKDPTDHEGRLIADKACAAENGKLFKMLKKCTAQGAARGKVKKHDSTKDGGKAHACLRSCYDQDGDRKLYAQGILSKLMGLSLEHNSPGGMDGHISKFEQWTDELELADAPMTEEQKHTFFLNGMKDKDCDSIKDQCDNDDYQTTVLKLRKKAIKINKASGGQRNGHRRTNLQQRGKKDNKKNNNNNEKNTGEKKMLRLPPDAWAKLGSDEKKWTMDCSKSDKKKEEHGSQCERQLNAKTTASDKDEKKDKPSDQPAPKTTTKVGWQLASSMGSGTRQQKLHTRPIAHKAFNNQHVKPDDPAEVAHLDSGSDTCGIGNNSWFIESKTNRKVTVAGYDSDAIKEDVEIGTGITAPDLPDETTVLLRVNEATLLGENASSLLSEMQLENHGVLLRKNDKGTRYLEADGHVLPLRVENAMLTLKIRHPTDHELRTLPQIELASDMPWNPETTNDTKSLTPTEYDDLVTQTDDIRQICVRKTRDQRDSNWWKHNRHFLHPGETIMKKTLQHTTQLGKISLSIPFKLHHKARNPLLQRRRLQEGYSTDTIFSTVTSFEGCNAAQPFTGLKSKYRSICGLKSESDGPDALLDFFRQIGVPLSLTRDNSKMQTSKLWNDCCRRFWVEDKFIEPYHPQQNPVEREMATWKQDCKKIMIDCNVDPRGWYRVMAHVADVCNHRAHPHNEDYLPPINVALGEVGDISLLTEFLFNDDVLYQEASSTFPESGGNEKLGKWHGRALTHGDKMCSWILNENNELIVRSNIRHATKTERPNASVKIPQRIQGSSENYPLLTCKELNENPTPNVQPIDIKQAHDTKESTNPATTLVPRNSSLVHNPEELIDTYVILSTNDRNGKATTKKGIVKERISEDEYRIELTNGKQRMLECNELIDLLTKHDDEAVERWTCEAVVDHRNNPSRGNGKIDVLMKWDEYEEMTWEPMEMIKKDDPVTLARHAIANELTEQQRWKWAKRYEKKQAATMKMCRQMLKAKRKARKVKYQFGVKVPRTVKEAYEFDKKNGNNLWGKAIQKEAELLRDTFECFKVAEDGEIADEFQQVPLLWAFAVKFDGRHRARLVAGGHVTGELEHDYYSGVVELETIRIAFVAAVLMELKVVAADVASAHIMAFTDELIFTVAGPEFGKWNGLKIIIVKALCGLKSSGAMWHLKFADNLRNMGFRPCKADFDLWIRDRGDHYECLAVMVDDLLVFSKNPELIIEPLKDIHGHELKGVGIPECCSGADVEFDHKRNCWAMSAKTCIKNACDKIEKLFDMKLKCYGSPLEAGDHPELDESDIVDDDTKNQYQMLIGSAQWAITLGRYDVQHATNSLAKFAQMPREGHLKRALRMFGYLKHTARGKMHFDPAPLGLDGIEFSNPHDWKDVHPDAMEDIGHDVPEPKTPTLQLAALKDASHCNDCRNGRGHAGYVVMLNSAIIKTHSKRQNTAESSTHGTELVAMRIATEAVLELRYKLRMMGIAVEPCSAILGDNKAVMLNMQMPSSTLKKKHNSVAFHKAREAIAAGHVRTGHIDGAANPADVLTKSLGPRDYYYHTGPTLFGRFMTRDSPDDDALGELQNTIDARMEHDSD